MAGHGISNLNPRIRFSFADPRFVIMVLGLIGLAVLPIIAGAADDVFMISFMAKMMIFAIAAASLDLILGYGGMISFGHAAYIGLGTYAVAVRTAVWAMLPHISDWRWLRDREDSPWYPSMRLFRQPAPRDWGPVFAQVKTELAEAVEAKNAGRWPQAAA